MRILYHHRIASNDGQCVHIEGLLGALRRQGHEIVMVSPGVAKGREFGSDGGLVTEMKRLVPRHLYELLELGYSLVAFAKLAAAVARRRPDFIYERYNLYLPAGVWISRLSGIPLLLEVNAPLFDERSRFGGIALRRLARWIEDRTWRGADDVLPVTAVLARMIRDRGVSADRITVIPNGIDPQQFPPDLDRDSVRSALKLDGQLVLGFTGFVREWHGLERVVDFLAAKGGRRHLLIVGDGPARSSIMARARAAGVADRVTITGIVARREIPRFIAAFDIALQPDVVAYASPLKLFEYLAMGRAVLAPDTPNMREILSHEGNALLFDPADAGAFERSLERLCEDTDLRRVLSDGARRTITERGLTWEQNARQVIGLAEARIAESKKASKSRRFGR